MRNKFSFKMIPFIIIWILLFAIYIKYAFSVVVLNDFSLHSKFIQKIAFGQNTLYGTFLLPLLSIIITLGSTNLVYIIISLCLIVSLSSFFKLYLSYKYIVAEKIFDDKFIYSFVVAVSLLFIFSIPFPNLYLYNYFYINTFTPNVWHNSTTILLFPFAILLFYYSYLQLIKYERKRDILIFVLIVINLAIKPNFFLTIITVFPFMSFYTYKLSNIFFQSLIPYFIGFFLIIIQYVFTYYYSNQIDQTNGVAIHLFAVYSLRTSLIGLPISLFFSNLFPIIYCSLNFKNLLKKTMFVYIIFMNIVAYLIYFLIVETGERFSDMNFYWQIVICSWILFFYCLIDLLKSFKIKKNIKRKYFLLLLYNLHVFAGILYLIRAFTIHIAE